jgi:RNA polymerase sporulation-specific sigma factor
MMELTLCPQDESLRQARSGDSLAFELLFAPVRPYAMGLARRFFVPGWDREDLYQEALAGFASALLSYEPERQVGFEDFARLCMRNSVVATVRRATRVKRQGEGAVMTSLEDLEATCSDEFRPDLMLEQQAGCAEMLESLRSALSQAEWSVLEEVLTGASLAEVASRVGLNQRAVENALSRARVKARRVLVAA